MTSAFNSAAPLARSYVLPRGPRVRLRLAQSRDIPGILALRERAGVALEELELSRWIRCDPRDTIAIAATALLGSSETVLGFGVIDPVFDEPRLVIADEGQTDGLDELLTQALVSRARAIRGRRAA